MASLDTFARRIRARGKKIEENANKTVIDTAIVVQQAVVLSTPVDEGRARGNWQLSLDAPILKATDDLSPTGSTIIAKNTATAQGRTSNDDVYISNNLPYITRLNEGWSAQAPAGFVELAIQAGVAAVRQSRLLD